MTDHSTDEIRDLLERAMSDSPEPYPWADVEQRARQPEAPPRPRRTRVWPAVAACMIALMGGLVAVVSSDDQPKVRVDAPGSITPSTSTVASTSAPPTVPGADAGWTGGLLDDIDGGSLRPLESLTTGDVVVPTAPSGWRVFDVSGPVRLVPDVEPRAASGDDADPASVEWSVEIIEAPPGNVFGQVLYLRTGREPTCRGTLGCTPSGESVTVNGVVWESIVAARGPEDDDQFVDPTSLRARVGDRWVWLTAGAPDLLSGPLLENPPIIEFLEGLRVGSPGDLLAIGTACWKLCGELEFPAQYETDPFAATESSTSALTTLPDGGPTATSQPPVQAPSDTGSDMGHPLTELSAGDVVVPAYLPPGLALKGAQILELRRGVYSFSFTLEPANGQYAISADLWESNEPRGPLGPEFLDDPNHPPVEIADVTWGWTESVEARRIAHIGSFFVRVSLEVLDRSEAERFIEGLRAVPLEQYPVPITFERADGISVTYPDSLADVEIVASDDRFDLAAVQIGSHACMKLADTTVPTSRTFAPKCWRALNGSGIVDVQPIGDNDTEYVITGVIDSSVATAVRITSPDGESVVVQTGPANGATDGRFFLARLDLDVNNDIRLDEFTIEDASP